MRQALIIACLLAVLAAGCGGGQNQTTPSTTSITSALTTLSDSSGNPGTAVPGAQPSGIVTAPTTDQTSIGVSSGQLVSLGLDTISPASTIFVGVQGLSGYYTLNLGATRQATIPANSIPQAGSRQAASSHYLLNLGISPTPGTSQLVLRITAQTNNGLTSPASVTVNIGSQNSGLPRTTRAAWTVLVFMNAANNLEPFSVENIDQMEQVPFNTKVNVAVQWKRFHEQGNGSDSTFDPSAPTWDGTRRFWITGRGGNGAFAQDQVQDLGSSVDMGDSRTLSDFIQWGRQNFPADHYLVVLWNHGAGWESEPTTVTTRAIRHRGVSYDDTTNNHIETWQLPQALSTGGNLDLLAMDASLMQMLEVTYQLRGVTPYIVGSEESPPGDGYRYDTWLSGLVSNPSMDAPTLGKLIADSFASYYQNHPDSGGGMDSVTQSVVSTAALQGVAQALNDLGNALLANESSFAVQFAAARDSAHLYAVETRSLQPACTTNTPPLPSNCETNYGPYKDLVEYATLLKQKAASAPGVSKAVDALLLAVNSAVIDNQATGQESFSHGLSIYVPVPGQYDGDYQNLTLAANTSWATWLQGQQQ